MADEKKWGKSDGPEPPEGQGGLGTPVTGNEAEGRGRQFVAVCSNCGSQSYIGPDWKWFTCWKCGSMSTETAVA